ncbi:MAG: methyltransferase domain-containing protein [Candidatus Omnitrophica bacterium]|nr:methyltransferase domain-containing protein [Candidatus Omnitrophota bacterium]
MELLKKILSRINPFGLYETYRGERYKEMAATDPKGPEWLYRAFFPGDIIPGREAHILDIGCAGGRITAFFAQDRPNVIGMDLKPDVGWKRAAKARFILADSEAIPFGNCTFDICSLIQVLEYVDGDRAALSEIYRVLKPGGRLVLQAANRDGIYSLITGKKIDARHRHWYTRDGITTILIEAGFRVLSVKGFGARIPVISRLIFMARPYPYPELYPDLFLSKLVPEKNRPFFNIVCEKLSGTRSGRQA